MICATISSSLTYMYLESQKEKRDRKWGRKGSWNNGWNFSEFDEKNFTDLDQEATIRTGHGTTDWFPIGKGVRQGCILSPCLVKLCAEYIMRNAGLEEAQVGIKIARRNINNLKYADDTTLVVESEEELKSILMKVKKEWKSWLKAQHSEN